MVTKQSDGTDGKPTISSESEVTLMGDGGVDKGTGLYPMGNQSTTYTQCVDNSSTGAVSGLTDPRTYEAHTDNGPNTTAEPTTEEDDEAPAKRGPGRPRKTGGK